MKNRFLWLAMALLVVGAAMQGCIYEVEEDDDGASSGAGNVTQSKAVGQACGCDTDCVDEGAVCFFGMCAKRATGLCAEPNTEAGCDPGSRCFNSDVLPDTGVCFPPYDPNVCEFVENRFNLCSPTRNDGCDATCGTACVADSTPAGTAGAACGSDGECTFNADAQCYADGGTAEPAGWVEGYCLSFACANGDECGGADKGCFPIATDDSGVCMNRCGHDFDCRWGYRCRHLEENAGSLCFAGCDEAALCPNGFSCVGNICVDATLACSSDNPNGWCPDGSWCDQGVCNEEPFACAGQDDSLEPNDSRDNATLLTVGATEGLFSCADNEDWYRVEVPAGKIVRVGIEFSHNAGDIDLVAYDGAGELLGSRYGKSYPYSYRDQETDTEYYGFYSEDGGESFYVRVVGYKPTAQPTPENIYSIHVDEYDHADGGDCPGAGFSLDDCIGYGAGGTGLLPFPFPNPNDSYVGGQYMWDTYANYRFTRRELMMAVRHAIKKTSDAFPGTTALGLIDVCQLNGITPGYDVGSPRHPETTHDQGGNIDIAYYQTDGNNSAEVICGDGSVHADGFCSSEATTKHKVDLPRQAYFMAQIFANSRTRVIGVDQVIGPLIKEAAQALNALDAADPQHITSSQLSGFNNGMAYGSGWPYHHHHIHLSMQWWSNGYLLPAPSGAGMSHRMRRSDALPGLTGYYSPDLKMAWPPRHRDHH